MEEIEATVVPGLQLASGTSIIDPIFNRDGGTIHLQSAAFKQKGLDLEAYFGPEGYKRGTLNLSLAPVLFYLGSRDAFHYVLEGVCWTDKLDKEGNPKLGHENKAPFLENFFLSPVQITFNRITYPALLYVPDPSTKPPQHLAAKPSIEVIAREIAGIQYGSKLTLHFDPKALKIVRPA